MKHKLHWIDVAEVIDSWRVFPRLFLIASFAWTVGITHELLHWYMQLPKAERSVEVSGFASLVFLFVSGFLKLVYDRYASTARDWNAAPYVATSTTTTQVVAPAPAAGAVATGNPVAPMLLAALLGAIFLTLPVLARAT